MECVFCGKSCKNDNSLRNHQRLCKKNPNCQTVISNFINYNKKRSELGIKGKNQFTKAKELGLPKPKISDKTRQKISESLKGRKYNKEQRLRHSYVMKKTVQNHPDSYTKNNVVGRVKNIIYKGVTLKGSWELIVAKWMDKKGIKWEHEIQSFDYEWNGVRKYYPDFYLPDFDLYIEVKGYETDRDLAKWKSVSNLVVFKLSEIKQLKEDSSTPLEFFTDKKK